MDPLAGGWTSDAGTFHQKCVQKQNNWVPLGGMDPLGGCGPPMQVLFTENVCENERIGSPSGACAGHALLDPLMNRKSLPQFCSNFQMKRFTFKLHTMLSFDLIFDKKH